MQRLLHPKTIAVIGEEGEEVSEAAPEAPEPEGEAEAEALDEAPEEEGSRAPARDEERERGREAPTAAEPAVPQPATMARLQARSRALETAVTCRALSTPAACHVTRKASHKP